MIDSAEIVSRILANANIKHRFEIYDHKDALACYLHHSWPQQNDI
jgi:hypothetical protein